MNTITLLDGGMGQELVKRSGDTPTALWSTQVMRDHPELVEEIHRDYFAAGAQIATANTYAIHTDRLARVGLVDEKADLIALAMRTARDAREAHGTGQVAGSIGPLGASYRAEIHPAPEIAAPLYAENLALIAPHSDLILFETVVSVAHARSAMLAAKGCDQPVWVAFTVDDEDGTRLRSGEPLRDALAVVTQADALLINCSAPEAIPPALDLLKTTGKPFGAYANAFTQITKEFLKDAPTVDALEARRDMGPDAYAAHVLDWCAQGATLVGGCCETGPAHIAEMKRQLLAQGYSLT